MSPACERLVSFQRERSGVVQEMCLIVNKGRVWAAGERACLPTGGNHSAPNGGSVTRPLCFSEMLVIDLSRKKRWSSLPLLTTFFAGMSGPSHHSLQEQCFASRSVHSARILSMEYGAYTASHEQPDNVSKLTLACRVVPNLKPKDDPPGRLELECTSQRH